MNTIKSLETVLCMKGGDGDSSYSRNSLSVQMKMAEAMKPVLESGIGKNTRVEWLRGLEGGVFRIADLGCATGVNTLLAADTIVNSVNQICIRHSIARSPEFQVLLRSCSDRIVLQASISTTKPTLRPLFRQPPVALADPRCPAWNGGGIFISNEAVAAAYLRQFTTDFTAFLEARSEEIVPEGSLFIALVGRNSCEVNHQDCLANIACHLEAAFDDLAAEGLIEEEKKESFNIPFFGPNVEELKKIVEMENSFEIESIKLLRGLPLHPMREVREGEEEMFGRVVANNYRALFESLVGAHLGSHDLIDHFFSRIATRAASKWQDYVSNQVDLLVAFLVRKA
eukprot:Gb_02312 [translate_table: standard]